MRVRALDENGDMTFGNGSANFLVNSPEAVAQCVGTALKLQQGEWFLDTTAGVPYATQVLGYNTANSRDVAMRNAILAVPGVTDIVSYSSSVDTKTRKFTVTAALNTLYGVANIQVPV